METNQYSILNTKKITPLTTDEFKSWKTTKVYQNVSR